MPAVQRGNWRARPCLRGLAALRGLPDSDEKRFILEMILYVVDRDR
jgi:hypothetical protein